MWSTKLNTLKRSIVNNKVLGLKDVANTLMHSGTSKHKRGRPSSSVDANFSENQWRSITNPIPEKAICNKRFGNWPEYS